MEEAGPHRKPWRPFTSKPGHTPTHAQAGFPCHLPKGRGQSAMRSKAMSWSAPQPLKAIPSERKLKALAGQVATQEWMISNCWGPQIPEVRQTVKSKLPEGKGLHRKYRNKGLHHFMSHSFDIFHFYVTCAFQRLNFPAPPRCPHPLE